MYPSKLLTPPGHANGPLYTELILDLPLIFQEEDALNYLFACSYENCDTYAPSEIILFNHE